MFPTVEDVEFNARLVVELAMRKDSGTGCWQHGVSEREKHCLIVDRTVIMVRVARRYLAREVAL